MLKARGKDIALPLAATPKETTPTVDLRQQTYEILSQLREPTPEEKKALKRRGLVFLPVGSKTYTQVVSETPDYFLKDELKYANSFKALREYAMPVAAEVGLKPAELALPNSFRLSQQAQLEMIEALSQALQTEFPDARAIMLPVTGYAQADQAYREKTGGEVLFKKYFARGLDMLSETFAAGAGRHDPSERFNVRDWDAHHGASRVGAVPAVVFVQK